MSLEKEIHQEKFMHSKQKAMINLLYTYGWVIEKIKGFLAKEDITHQQFNILRILRGSFPKPLSTLQIRERMLDKMSDTSRIVDRLVLKKLDTEADHIEEIMGNLSQTESEQLNALLDKLRNTE